MSGSYRCSFQVAVPVERLWQAFTDPGERARLFAPPEHANGPAGPHQSQKVLEVQPMELLKWSQEGEGLADRAEFTVLFEATDAGSRFTVIRDSFGEGEEADVFAESNGLGWSHGFRDLALYLETGQIVKRHDYGVSKSCTAMVYAERDWGVEVRRVGPGGFAAEAGLQPGDRLVRIGEVPIYTREDIWLLVTEHEAGREFSVEFIRDGQVLSGKGRLSALEMRMVGE
jgi:uncharacterized protein YndB with AHSA1/START domain